MTISGDTALIKTHQLLKWHLVILGFDALWHPDKWILGLATLESGESLQAMSKLIAPGREEGWLRLSVSNALPAWARLNNVEMHSVHIGASPESEQRGSAIIASQDLHGGHSQTLMMTVPRDLILSLESVKRHALSDRRLKEVLDAVGDFGNVS